MKKFLALSTLFLGLLSGFSGSVFADSGDSPAVLTCKNADLNVEVHVNQDLASASQYPYLILILQTEGVPLVAPAHFANSNGEGTYLNDEMDLKLSVNNDGKGVLHVQGASDQNLDCVLGGK